MLTKQTMKRAASSRRATRVSRKHTVQKIPHVTYATLAVTPGDDEAYDAAVAKRRGELGKHFANYVNGAARGSSAGEFAHASPIDARVIVSYFPSGTREDARDAIRAAVDAWSALDYRDRSARLHRAAKLMVERRFDLAAEMAFEVGKNRAESLAEVNESAELIRYYCAQMEQHQGFVQPLASPGAGQTTVSVLRLYGVWAVIAPWNFPIVGDRDERRRAGRREYRRIQTIVRSAGDRL